MQIIINDENDNVYNSKINNDNHYNNQINKFKSIIQIITLILPYVVIKTIVIK